MCRNIFKNVLWLFIFSLIVTFSLAANEELLKERDVNNIMQQIFEQHIDKKEMSKEILKHSFQIYIDQFDPDKTYLLESEVAPFLNPSDAQMAIYIGQYKTANFSAYDQINTMIQKAIGRAQESRSSLERDTPSLFNGSKKFHLFDDSSNPNHRLQYAKTPEELKQRIKNQLHYFIHNEMHRFGEDAVLSKQKPLIDFYENQLRSYENQYLFRDDQNHPLPAPQQENLMTLHILKALASSLDAHTTFFNNAEAYDMRVHLEKQMHGIGVVLQQGLDGMIISQLIADGPAAKSGQLKVNDEIIEIDGKSIVGEPFERVMDAIHGEDGSVINLKIKRKGDLAQSPSQFINVSLKREPMVVNNDRVDVSYETFGNGIIGKLVLHSFYQSDNGISSEQDLYNAIEQLKKQGHLRGLILDLRENSGGFLIQAIKVVGLFISDGVVVVSKYANGEEQFYRDIDKKKDYDGPLVVLTSKATASAAEIVAQALQDYGVALVVGDERTYGKGSIQSQTVTDNHSTSFFKVTVGKYYTVSGKSPQIRGVLADIVVPGAFSRENLGEEYLQYPLSYDTIPPAFNDQLQDVEPQYKPWFLKYYVPSIQHPVDEWRNLLPILKKNSTYRIAHNKNYQLFLKKLDGKDENAADDSMSETELATDGTQKNFGSEDLQLNEAVNIVKDMIILHSQVNTQTVGSALN